MNKTDACRYNYHVQAGEGDRNPSDFTPIITLQHGQVSSRCRLKKGCWYIRTVCECVRSFFCINAKQTRRKHLTRLPVHLLTPLPLQGDQDSSVARFKASRTAKLFTAGSPARARRSSSAVVLETELQPFVDMTFYQSPRWGGGVACSTSAEKRKKGTRASGTSLDTFHSGVIAPQASISCSKPV
ncbi:hypothetical protein Baya_14894 [Bagarius yarrelli]|uniref:Uncharacterized protein n=1 Tax=Bagarius yarrelli TaxID=175774 RepID=A0A556VA80_BAGYA|nr:hypothetical protein Baya_14894 [Bagarius yarrelli]